MSVPLLRRGRLSLGIGVAVLVLLIDWATKSWVLGRLGGGQPFIDVMPFLNIVLTWNQGVSFGMFGGGRVPPLVLSLVSVAIVVMLLRWLVRATLAWSGVALGLVIGGALGNVIDRVRYSAVVDFIDVHVQGWHWPAFNVADSAIVVGVLMLVLESLIARGTVSK